jgi:3D (Asp-Asp-Asp) domain-containing protein
VVGVAPQTDPGKPASGAWRAGRMRWLLFIPASIILLVMSAARSCEPVAIEEFVATAYALRGRTASGDRVRTGIVAADPHVLPLGSKIRILGAGDYSGTYRVKDTGRKIKGKRLDIYVPNRRAAIRFGRQEVLVEVIEYGETTDG